MGFKYAFTPGGQAAGLLAASFLTACSPSGGDDATSTPSVEACAGAEDTLQSLNRFKLGNTFYFKTVNDACTSASWALLTQPAGSSAAIKAGADGYQRFTPDRLGTYAFEEASGEAFELKVVSAETYAFHNLNYFGSESVDYGDGHLYIAQTYAPIVSVVNAETLETQFDIPVGDWPVAVKYIPGTPQLLVVQRGADSLGILDLESQTLVDALWVGDEPSNIVLSPDGQRAYISLATEAAVVVVDLAAREVITRIDGVVDPLALALSPDGKTLWVASHRSGQSSRFPYDDGPIGDQLDLQSFNTEDFSLRTSLYDVSVLFNRMIYSQDGNHLYITGRSNNTAANLGDPEDPSFEHEVIILDANDGSEVHRASLTHQDGSGGHAVALHGIVEVGDHVWVTAEGSDLAIALDGQTLEEIHRISAPGRPRGITSDGENIYIHGTQGFELTKVSAEGEHLDHRVLYTDPRPAEVAAGLRYFTGAGREYGENWSCNSCHLDGLTDTLIWNAGPFEDYVVPRPLFWLEGAYPLGWAGYLYDVRNYAYEVNTNVGIRPTTDEAVNLWRYLASIMPPPPANGLTERDGSLSEAGLRGQALYEGKGGCANCHALPLTTNHVVFGEGVTEGPSDVPVLVGAYRHNTWMKTGISPTVEASITDMVHWSGAALSNAEVADISRYLKELTARDFFMLVSEPRANAKAVPVDDAITLTFAYEVDGSAENLESISVMEVGGAAIDFTASLSEDGRHLEMQVETLNFDSAYEVLIGQDFKALDGRTMAQAQSFTFTTARAPQLAFEGAYEWVVQMPAFDPANGGFNTELTNETKVAIEASADGEHADLLVDYLDDLTLEDRAVIDGDILRTGHLPVPIGPSFADTTALEGTLVDEDGDGIGDRAEGFLTISGPGFLEEGIAWEMRRPPAAGSCDEGAHGNPPVEVVVGDDGAIHISWEGGNALALYVTDSTAKLPTGPIGTVSNGAAYWVLEAEDFPGGFAGPVTYGILPDGALDTSEKHGGETGGAALPSGACVMFSVLSTDFTYGDWVIRWP